MSGFLSEDPDCTKHGHKRLDPKTAESDAMKAKGVTSD